MKKEKCCKKFEPESIRVVAGDMEFVEVSSYTSSVSQNARLGLAWQTVGAH